MTTILRKEKEGLFLYRGEKEFRVHPDEEEKLTWFVFTDISTIPTKAEFDIRLTEGITIPNDCYEIRESKAVYGMTKKGIESFSEKLAYFKSPEQSQENLKQRSRDIELLEKYSLFLEKNGYLDTDWRTEPPFAIDEFLRS